jgi:hypothetical protein
LCMQMNEPEKVFKSKIWDSAESEKSNSVNIWDYSDSEAAPASSWSALPNRSLTFFSFSLHVCVLCSFFFFSFLILIHKFSNVGLGFRALLCRPLPLDIGRCTCVIMKEALPEGLDGGTLYSLYTNVSCSLTCI